MLQAVIFDLNGVIVDDEKHHQHSWRELAKIYKLTLTEDQIKHHITGRRTLEALEYLFKRKLTDEESSRLMSERFEIVREVVEAEVTLTSGLREFLETLKSKSIPIAIATGSRTPYFNLIMDKFKLRDYFKVVTTAEEVTKGKPDPQIYLITAEKLKIKPKDCLVFEDSISGIKAGKAAGMRVVAITTTHTKVELDLADEIIDTFKDIDIRQYL